MDKAKLFHDLHLIFHDTNYKGDLVPTIQTGAGAGSQNAGLDFMEVMGAKAAMDLSIDLDVKKE